jgi:hypothetical protein
MEKFSTPWKTFFHAVENPESPPGLVPGVNQFSAECRVNV